jgi:hypothetical protein
MAGYSMKTIQLTIPAFITLRFIRLYYDNHHVAIIVAKVNLIKKTGSHDLT